MSILQILKEFRVFCNGCGNSLLVPFKGRKEIREISHTIGWTSIKKAGSGAYNDFCPECTKKNTDENEE